MTNKLPTVPLPLPNAPAFVPADVVTSGLPIPAIDRIKIFSNVQWEEFVLEWADSLRGEYALVERCGGAGDMGRDVIANVKNDSAAWDNYQCKHYRDPLAPTDIWIEIGKLVYYSYCGHYSYPRRYFFVAPQGAGTKLSNLFKKPDDLRSQLVTNWNSQCCSSISSKGAVQLDDQLTKYINSLDFSIFQAIPPLRLIDEHSKTRWHVARFGGGLPARPSVAPPPFQPTPHEAIYVTELLNAYSQHLNRAVNTVDDLVSESDLRDHFDDSRLEFYSAEALRLFSRDTLPPGAFESLQDEFHNGIRDEIRNDHANGYRRLLAVVRMSRLLQVTGHSLSSRISTRDRGGICHQLANDKKVRWVR